MDSYWGNDVQQQSNQVPAPNPFPVPYTRDYNRSAGHELWEDIEAGLLVLILGWVFKRVFRRHHLFAGIIFILSSVAAFFVLINSNYGDNGEMVMLFWGLIAIALVSLARGIS